MTEDTARTDDDVSVSLEVSGKFDEVMRKIGGTKPGRRDLSTVVRDLHLVLDTVERLDGGTRSAVADSLPDDVTAEFDAEGVVDVMQVLERYDLVALEGNTWRPGPALDDS